MLFIELEKVDMEESVGGGFWICWYEMYGDFLVKMYISYLNIDLKVNSEIWISDVDLRLVI